MSCYDSYTALTTEEGQPVGKLGILELVVAHGTDNTGPLLFGGLVALGEAIVGLDVVGAGIYAFLNRLLIPTGLHHALNNVFWFDTQ